MTVDNSIQLAIHDLKIPFKVSFKHASAERSQTQSILVEARSTDGLVGYGESCPREYVTGESIASVHQFFERHRPAIASSIQDLAGLKAWSAAHRDVIDKNPAAWCAIELALLDLLAKQNNQSVEALLSLPELTGAFHYSAILGDGNIDTIIKQFQQYRVLGFTDYKVKLSGDREKDQQKLQLINVEGGGKYRIRVDANNLWQGSKAAIDYMRELKVSVYAIEEPLVCKDIPALATLGEALNIPIILDESFTCCHQFPLLDIAPPHRWIINVRVSKMGGLLRALDIIQQAGERNISVIVGAQVGETSILTRAALTVANVAHDILIAQEGAFGTLLLAQDICEPSLMWGKRGALDIESLRFNEAKGFGLMINGFKK
ncbi:MAG TPA: enolase C-terminal domain-like protein [Gammaproteobacteria bacterium]